MDVISRVLHPNPHIAGMMKKCCTRVLDSPVGPVGNMSHPPGNFRTMAENMRNQPGRDEEAILAAERALIEAGFGFTVVLEETGRQEAEAALATRPPLAA